MINWNCSLLDPKLITAIVKKAITVMDCFNDKGDYMLLEMDITACHCNGTPMDLEKFLNFPAFDFAHDVIGIIQHINRETGMIEAGFLPRCSKTPVNSDNI